MTYVVEGRRCFRACVEGYKFQDADTRVVDVSKMPLGASNHRLCPNAALRYALDVVWSKIYLGELP
jgi:hypothetical protein